MRLISIKRYLMPGRDADVLLEVLRVLLRGLKAQSMIGDQRDYSKFQDEIDGLEKRVGNLSASEILVSAGAMAKAIEEYSEHTARHINTLTHELQRMLMMTTATVGTLCSGSDRHAQRLREIEQQIESAAMIEDVRVIRSKLTNCLENLRIESLEHTQQMTQRVADLSQELHKLRSADDQAPPPAEPPAEPPQPDEAENIADREQAERALSGAMESESRCWFATIFSIDRVKLINARFGYATGDKVLLLARNHLKRSLAAGDRLFRWTGPVYLALVNREGGQEQVMDEVRKITSMKLGTTVRIGNRSVLLPISATSIVFPVAKMHSHAEFIRRIDEFIAGPSCC